jgi:hypothetical protein
MAQISLVSPAMEHPVLAFQSIASTINRLSLLGRASRPRSAGKSGSSSDLIPLVNIFLIQELKQIQPLISTLKTRPNSPLEHFSNTLSR